MRAATPFSVRRAAASRPAVVAALTVALALPLAALSLATGCTTTEEVTYVGYSADSPAPRSERRKPQPDDPLPPIGNVQVISGDTLRLTGGQMLKLYGVRAPQPGEPYYLTAKRWLETLIGHQIVRFTYKAGTRYTDSVWYVNLLVPSRDREHPGALSANMLLLANGLAREDGIGSLRFARVGENGKLQPLSEQQNEAIRATFRKHAAAARADNRSLHSGVREP